MSFSRSSDLTASEQALSQIALKINSGADLHMLVGGLGSDYTTEAALNSVRATNCEVVEHLPEAIRRLEQ